jgi:hypothetical protein
MNYEKALDILNIDASYTESHLRQAYYKHSLKYHPDKNTSDNAIELFRNGKSAYEFLREYKSIPAMNDDSDTSYISLFKRCMRYIVPDLENSDDIINCTIKTLFKSCKNTTLKMIENMERDKAIYTYSYLKKHKDTFRIDDDVLAEILDIIKTKAAADDIVILNPNIDDLLNNKIYKLRHEGVEYYIPLWHNEISYDICGSDLIIRCIPELESHLFIDNSNNLHITISRKILHILNNRKIAFNIGDKEFEINSDELNIIPQQTHIIKNKGILVAHYDKLYDTTNRGDIYVYITLHE